MISVPCSGGKEGVGTRKEILTFDGLVWKEVGQMITGRMHHAVAKTEIKFCPKGTFLYWDSFIYKDQSLIDKVLHYSYMIAKLF